MSILRDYFGSMVYAARTDDYNYLWLTDNYNQNAVDGLVDFFNGKVFVPGADKDTFVAKAKGTGVTLFVPSDKLSSIAGSCSVLTPFNRDLKAVLDALAPKLLALPVYEGGSMLYYQDLDADGPSDVSNPQQG